MTMNKDFWKISYLSTTEKVRLHILYMACIRFVVEKHGGNMETDPGIRIASIKIPRSKRIACMEELRALKLVKAPEGASETTVSA